MTNALAICGAYGADSKKALNPVINALLGYREAEKSDKLDVKALYEQALKSFGMQSTQDGKFIKLPGKS